MLVAGLNERGHQLFIIVGQPVDLQLELDDLFVLVLQVGLDHFFEHGMGFFFERKLVDFIL